MHSLKKPQIAYLKVDKALTKVPSKYTDFTDVFSPKLAAKLQEHIKINNYTIELVEDSKFSYDFIYSLDLMGLEIIKTYIENNLANDFIKLFRFPIRVFIFFAKKPDRNLRLCTDY